MKKKFQPGKDFLIKSNAMYLHEFDGKQYMFTDNPAVAWGFTAVTLPLRLTLVRRSHPQAIGVPREEAPLPKPVG